MNTGRRLISTVRIVATALLLAPLLALFPGAGRPDPRGPAVPALVRAQTRPLYLPLAALAAHWPLPAATLATAPATPSPDSPTPSATATEEPRSTTAATATASATPPSGSASPTPAAARAWPDSRRGIPVFNDQLPGLGNLTEAQIRFAVSHYVGTQKLTRPDADRLRALNPGFLILHYRLGMGLGYRIADGDCQPTGDWLQIVDGARWVREWPPEDLVKPSWFFPYGGQERVFFCPNGWTLMNLDDPGYRDWWLGEVLRQLADNDDDGLFADSLSVPNFFGGGVWRPRLPDVDAAFEADWARRIEDGLTALKARMGSRYALLPNAGNWVNSRDPVRYTAADGVMVEGFASWGPGRLYDPADWRLQMNRILALTGQGRILIAQSYPDAADVEHRMFTVASYLLVKGRRSYINQEFSMAPEWWPEYELPVGAYLAEPPTSVDQLLDPALGVYRRDYEGAMVLVNPGPDTRQVKLDTPRWHLKPIGGGLVPADGRTPGYLTGPVVRDLTLAPGQGAVLTAPPTPAPVSGRTRHSSVRRYRTLNSQATQ
ncbi:MAG: hypothetical protein IPJ58_13500 [Ardenticatenia bacterium]|nr:hypothetical protein [Ardenticatenia bacterium]